MPKKRQRGQRMPVVTVRVPDHMIEAVQAEADRTGRSPSMVVRAALAEHLNVEPWAADDLALGGAA